VAIRSPAILLMLAAAAGCSDANPIEALRNPGDDCLYPRESTSWGRSS